FPYSAPADPSRPMSSPLPPAPTLSPRPSDLGEPPRPANILIADDSQVILALVEAILQELEPEPQIRTAANGSKAIAQIDEETPDLVITDIRMPGADGLQLLAHVVNKRLPTVVIAMTGYATAQLRAEVMREGAYLLLEKPLDPKGLRDAARRGLEKFRTSENPQLSLPSLLELIELEAKSCEVAVSGDQEGGFLVFQDGRIVHARTQDQEGDAAALDLLSLPWPLVDVRESFSPHPHTVTRSLDRLLEDATYNGYDVDAQIFETKELPTVQQPAPSFSEEQFHELLTMVREFRGFRGASLIDLDIGSARFQETFGEGGERLTLPTAPVRQLIQAEKMLVDGGLDAASNLLIRQPRYWHLIRELKGDLALHLVFNASANVALAQYQLTRRLITYGLVEEPKPEVPVEHSRLVTAVLAE
ncbi:MAG: response regulator, partial [Acidobacteriota bacterium]